MMRSTYRCRARVSSASSLCATGSGRNALAAMRHSAANTLSSPRRDVPTSPRTKMWSPMSTSAFHASSASAPTTCRLSITCSGVPSPACSVAKHSLPVLRRNSTLPATPTVSPVMLPGCRSGYRVRTSGIVAVMGRAAA